MPYFDGTGPFGNGPIGRRRGPCAGYGFRGYRNFNSPAMTEKDEHDFLTREKELAEKDLQEINARLKKLNKQ